MAGFAVPAFVVADLDGPALAAAGFGGLALATTGLDSPAVDEDALRVTSPGAAAGPPPMGLVSLEAGAALLIAGSAISPGTKPPANAARPPNPESELLPGPPPLELCLELTEYPGGLMSALPSCFFF
ncbi:hypothetical protein E4T56_gene3051 [Termitomyces sp. T112]|nr:hypothetical protein E4T56_gene3051 [Termitomyces sp. T112]